MTLFNGSNTNPQTIVNQVQQGLLQIRNAMLTAQALQSWAAGTALADLTTPPPDGPGMPAPDAQWVLSACADAGGLAALYNTGTDPRNPGANYVYGASQKIVIGPRVS